MESLIILKIVACGQVGTAPVPDLMARCRQMNVQAADRPVLSWDNDSYLLLDALGLTALDNLVSSEEQVRFMSKRPGEDWSRQIRQAALHKLSNNNSKNHGYNLRQH